MERVTPRSNSTPFTIAAENRRHHPAIHQSRESDYAAVGILDTASMPAIVIWDGRAAAKHDANKAHEHGRLTGKPIAYAKLAGRWPDADLTAFLADPSAPTWGEVVSRVRAQLEHYIEFSRPEDATFVACWIVGTYFYQLSPAFPRLNVNGEKRSGKSRVVKVASALAFNGLFFVAPSVASLFRLIHSSRPTLCLDEMETLGNTERQTLLALVNAGYTEGGSVPRVEGEDRHVEGFDVYAPLAVAGIAGLNAVTADRAVTVHMVRSIDPSKVNLEIDTRDDDRFGPIRADLYRLALLRYPEYQQADPSTPPWLLSRPHELFRPILKVAMLADASGATGMQTDILKVAARAVDQDEGLSEESRALLCVLEGRLTRVESVTIYPGDLTDDMADEMGVSDEPSQKPKSGDVGRTLRRLGFEPGRRDKRGIPYPITREAFEKAAEQYSYPFTEWSRPPQSAGRFRLATAGVGVDEPLDDD